MKEGFSTTPLCTNSRNHPVTWVLSSGIIFRSLHRFSMRLSSGDWDGAWFCVCSIIHAIFSRMQKSMQKKGGGGICYFKAFNKSRPWVIIIMEGILYTCQLTVHEQQSARWNVLLVDKHPSALLTGQVFSAVHRSVQLKGWFSGCPTSGECLQGLPPHRPLGPSLCKPLPGWKAWHSCFVNDIENTEGVAITSSNAARKLQ